MNKANDRALRIDLTRPSREEKLLNAAPKHHHIIPLKVLSIRLHVCIDNATGDPYEKPTISSLALVGNLQESRPGAKRTQKAYFPTEPLVDRKISLGQSHVRRPSARVKRDR